MKIQQLNPSKLFYKKWPFKVECRIAGANRITIYGPEAVKGWVNGDQKYTHWHTKNIDQSEILAFVNAVEPFLFNPQVQVRTEGSHFNLFCKDIAVLESIDQQLKKWIVKISGPTTKEELEYLLSNGHKKILCDSKPKNSYQYRIYFASKFPEDKRIPFYDWCKKYGEKVDISPTSERWLTGSKKWVQNPFMYVQDDKMLSMVGLQITGYVKRVEEFIERNSVLVT